MPEFHPVLNDDPNPYCKAHLYSPEYSTQMNNIIFANTPGWQTEDQRILRWREFWKKQDANKSKN